LIDDSLHHWLKSAKAELIGLVIVDKIFCI